MNRRTILWAAAVALCVAVGAWADAAGDLSAGRAALAGGDVAKAIGLLESAAQALPQSVEAQLELARAYLQAGQLEKALTQYRAVLKLSPDHAEARRLVEALTTQRQTFEQKLAYTRSLMELNYHAVAAAQLAELAKGPYEPGQRLAARMALAEATLWQRFELMPLPEVLRAVNEAKGTPSEGPARVMAALALVTWPEKEFQAQAADMLKAAGDLPAPWKQRAELVDLLLKLDEKTAADVSARLAGPLASIPLSEYRNGLIDRVVTELTASARRLADHDPAAALRMLVPMLAAEPPAKDANLSDWSPKALDGWLVVITRQTVNQRFIDKALLLTDALAEIGRREFARSGPDASLAGLTLAGEYLRVLSDRPGSSAVVEKWLALTEQLASLSRPAADRRKGAKLSRADDLQRAWMLPHQLAGRLTDEAQRARLVNALIGQVGRYEQAADLEAGLKRFIVMVEEPAKGALVHEVTLVVEVAPGPALVQELLFLADKHAVVGQQAFAKAAAAGDRKADILSANRADQIATVLYRKAAALSPQDSRPTAEANKIADRYAAADRWGEAEQVLGLFYETVKGDAGRWAVARLKLRQAVAAEDKQLAGQHKLPDALDPLTVAAFKTVTDILKEDPSDGNKAAASGLAGSLIGRYQQLDRVDLAEAVIAAMTPAGVDALADWALLARADLLDAQGSAMAAVAARQFDGARKLALNDRHAAELKLLGELLDRFPDSRHAPAAVERVTRLVQLYQGYKAFDVAVQLLADFVKARPNIQAAERLSYSRVQVLIAKAFDAFSDRPDKDKPPARLSDEYGAAIDELAAFLKARPTGPYSPAALAELVSVARAYGQAGGWPVARDVLKRFGAAVPDFRQPERLRLMEAATYLGELDKGHGLGLLAPPPPPTTRGFLYRGDWAGHDKDWVSAILPGGGAPGEKRSGSEGRPATEAPPPPVTVTTPAGPALPPPAPAPRPEPADRLEEVHDLPVTSLAMIRQAEQEQSRRIARMNEPGRQGGQSGQAAQAQQQEVVLPAGPVLSEAEMKRQDTAADAAYVILIELVKARPGGSPAVVQVGDQARTEIMWLVGFFEGHLRANRAVALIERFLADQPTDPARVALDYQGLTDRLVWAGQRQPTDKIDQAWVDARHDLFQQARKAIDDYIKQFAAPEQKDWANRARLLTADSYEQEAGLVAGVSAARAAGLLARAADELLALADAQPDHPQAGSFPQRLWNIADRLTGLGQRDQAIYVLSRLPMRFPTDSLASQAVLRIAQLYAANLSVPLRAVETYQEYLALAGDNESIRSQIFSVAQQLASKRRYLEALHVYGVFVDCFPTDARAPQALLAIGQTHQANEAWTEAKAAYQRILDEYGAHAVIPQVKLAMAECEIQLSNWRAARKIYEEYLQQYAGVAAANPPPNVAEPLAQPAPQQPAGSQTALATERIEILKSLDRYQTLLADKEVTRNKDDAQFQIGRIVLERMNNRVKAIKEFAKVLKDYPKSDQADDAQFEIGKALLALGRLDEARAALLKVPADYPTSPLADDALYQVGQSYEQQAVRLAGVTLEKARDIAFEAGQRGAYAEFQKQQVDVNKLLSERRAQLKTGGKGKELELEEAYAQFRYNPNTDPNLTTLARKAEQEAETESALQLANRQDRINEAYRQAVAVYGRAAKDYPLGTATSESLMRMAEIYEVQLKDRASAMNTYQQIVKVFPGTPVAENAAWKVVKFYEQEGKFNEAVNAYRDFIRNYPASPRVAEAQYAMAEALEQLGMWVQAMDAYQTFREKFTTHPKAKMAEEQIQWIRAYRK